MKTLGLLSRIQKNLEEKYGAHTGLEVQDFVRSTPRLDNLGTLLVQQSESDLDLALLFDRDIFAAFEGQPGRIQKNRALSVSFEEVSHFVYLSFNHARGRNITQLEMEMQSEVDRVYLAFHGPLDDIAPTDQNFLLHEALHRPHASESYETARKAAANFLRQLSGGDPRAWTAEDLRQLRKFFHSDLSEKLHLAKLKG